MTLDRWALLVHAGATLYMVGLIWFVQLVHYPLFGRVGAAGFPAYEAEHQRRTTLAVGPPMVIEALCALLLAVRVPSGAAPWVPWFGLGLLAAVWLSTALLQVPRHGELARGFDARAHRRLVATNRLRTALWSARGVLALALLA